MQDIESKKVNTVIVKDLSRLGRNHIMVGLYTEMTFPKYGVRFMEKYIIVKNMHDPTIDEETFEIVQRLRKGKKRPNKSTGEPPLFAGSLKCSTCGDKLRQKRYTVSQEKFGYACDTSTRRGREYCTSHWIKEYVLYDLVLANIQKVTRFVTEYEQQFFELLSSESQKYTRIQNEEKQKALLKTQKRISELEGLINRIYEYNFNKKISDERYYKMSRQYEAEQAELTQYLDELKKDIAKMVQKQDNTERFMKIVKKYTEIEKLDRSILNELIEKIVVYDTEIIDGEKMQKIEIYYNFVGVIPVAE